MEYNIGGKIIINDKEFVGYEVIRPLESGANGVVFVVIITLERLEVLKIWLTKRNIDKRDKIKQGLLESQKLAKIEGINAVQIFTAKVFEGLLIATMEYFEAQH